MMCKLISRRDRSTRGSYGIIPVRIRCDIFPFEFGHIFATPPTTPFVEQLRISLRRARYPSVSVGGSNFTGPERMRSPKTLPHCHLVPSRSGGGPLNRTRLASSTKSPLPVRKRKKAGRKQDVVSDDAGVDADAEFEVDHVFSTSLVTNWTSTVATTTARPTEMQERVSRCLLSLGARRGA